MSDVRYLQFHRLPLFNYIQPHFEPSLSSKRLQFMWAPRPQYENKGSNKLCWDLEDTINYNGAAYLCVVL